MELNQAHLHLILNHLPVVGSIVVFMLLLAGLIGRNRSLITAGLVGWVLVAIVAVPVFLSGEGAEEMVEGQGNVNHDYIEAHEEVATLTYYAALAAGAFALLALGVGRGRHDYPGWASGIAFVLSIAAVGLTGITASLGGKISHPEIRHDGLLPYAGSWMPDLEMLGVETPGEDSSAGADDGDDDEKDAVEAAEEAREAAEREAEEAREAEADDNSGRGSGNSGSGNSGSGSGGY